MDAGAYVRVIPDEERRRIGRKAYFGIHRLIRGACASIFCGHAQKQ